MCVVISFFVGDVGDIVTVMVFFTDISQVCAKDKEIKLLARIRGNYKGVGAMESGVWPRRRNFW